MLRFLLVCLLLVRYAAASSMRRPGATISRPLDAVTTTGGALDVGSA